MISDWSLWSQTIPVLRHLETFGLPFVDLWFVSPDSEKYIASSYIWKFLRASFNSLRSWVGWLAEERRDITRSSVRELEPSVILGRPTNILLVKRCRVTLMGVWATPTLHSALDPHQGPVNFEIRFRTCDWDLCNSILFHNCPLFTNA